MELKEVDPSGVACQYTLVVAEGTGVLFLQTVNLAFLRLVWRRPFPFATRTAWNRLD